jgi:DNA polymerase-3 subunit epsilon
MLEGKNALFRITEKYNLCQKINGLYDSKTSCFQYDLKACSGACVGKEETAIYNARAQEFITKNSFESQSMVLIDKGRYLEERSAVLVENGVYKGYCFYDLNYQITNVEILKTLIIQMQNNRDTRNIIQGFMRRNPKMKVIKF